ncbi:MAG: GNAT family N-acetyltransferase [Candidatus Hodarchaeales archaeon]|jgi:GNAT superfamily N-acetyltransferase
MGIEIKIDTNISESNIDEFLKKEWISANLLHFGRDISDEINTPLNVKAVLTDSNSTLVGAAKCIIAGNTLRVIQLLVKEKYREKHRVGSQILKFLENLAHERGWHKIRLSTSRKHENLLFYQKNGFKIEATLENDAFNTTWYILSKFL